MLAHRLHVYSIQSLELDKGFSQAKTWITDRVFHTFGIPMIAVSIPLFLIAPLVRGFWKIPLSLFTAGWICQVFGQIIEGVNEYFTVRIAKLVCLRLSESA